jgi:chromosome segregation ATPase
MNPPGGLGKSKYAPDSPANKKPQPAVVPSYGNPAQAKPYPAVAPVYGNPALEKPQPAVAPAVEIPAFTTTDSTIATKQQIAAVKRPAAELAVEQAAMLKKAVETHTADFSKAVASAVENTRKLLRLLRESTASSEITDGLWQELEQLFEAANATKSALPQFMEDQRNNMSLFHSSMMNETIQETQAELNLQHKKVNTQHNLLLQQQEAFQNYRSRTDSSLKELESLQERVSRLTLEKGNFKTEVDKYKAMLEQEIAGKAEDHKTADALQKELETLVSSKKQLEVENETLRKTTTDTIGQLKHTEQKLNKDLVKLQTEHRLLSVKYNNQSSEHAGTMTVSRSFMHMFGQY